MSEETYRDIHFLKHGNSLPRINEGHILRCAHNHCAIYHDELTEAQCHITRTWRHVNDEDVESWKPRVGCIRIGRHTCAPVHVKQELLYGFHHHQTAPDNGCVSVRA